MNQSDLYELIKLAVNNDDINMLLRYLKNAEKYSLEIDHLDDLLAPIIKMLAANIDIKTRKAKPKYRLNFYPLACLVRASIDNQDYTYTWNAYSSKTRMKKPTIPINWCAEALAVNYADISGFAKDAMNVFSLNIDDLNELRINKAT